MFAAAGDGSRQMCPWDTRSSGRRSPVAALRTGSRRAGNPGWCATATWARLLATRSRPSTETEGFEGFGGKERFRAAHDIALEFSSRPEGWLVLVGPHGTGKTHLAAAISNRLIQNGYSVFFVHVPELLDHLRSAYSPASETTYDELFEQVKGTPILVMDELHSGNPTPWSQEKLRQLINHRSNAQLPTIITTALPPEESDPYIRVRIESEGQAKVFRLGARAHQASS